MVEISRTETMVDEIRLIECRYDSGLTEIGVYRPQILVGAGPVLCAVISRQGPERGMKWCVTTIARNHAFKSLVKRAAIAFAIDYAKEVMASSPKTARDSSTRPEPALAGA